MSNESKNAFPRHLICAFGAVAASTLMLGLAAAPARSHQFLHGMAKMEARPEQHRARIAMRRVPQSLAARAARNDVPAGRG